VDTKAISSADVRQFVDELERRFQLGAWGVGVYESTLAVSSYDSYPIWGPIAGTLEATQLLAYDLARFSAGCEGSVVFGDERWIAAAIWLGGLQGVSPRDVMTELPSWRTADR